MKRYSLLISMGVSLLIVPSTSLALLQGEIGAINTVTRGIQSGRIKPEDIYTEVQKLGLSPAASGISDVEKLNAIAVEKLQEKGFTDAQGEPVTDVLRMVTTREEPQEPSKIKKQEEPLKETPRRYSEEQYAPAKQEPVTKKVTPKKQFKKPSEPVSKKPQQQAKPVQQQQQPVLEKQAPPVVQKKLTPQETEFIAGITKKIDVLCAQYLTSGKIKERSFYTPDRIKKFNKDFDTLKFNVNTVLSNEKKVLDEFEITQQMRKWDQLVELETWLSKEEARQTAEQKLYEKFLADVTKLWDTYATEKDGGKILKQESYTSNRTKVAAEIEALLDREKELNKLPSAQSDGTLKAAYTSLQKFSDKMGEGIAKEKKKEAAEQKKAEAAKTATASAAAAEQNREITNFTTMINRFWDTYTIVGKDGGRDPKASYSAAESAEANLEVRRLQDLKDRLLTKYKSISLDENFKHASDELFTISNNVIVDIAKNVKQKSPQQVAMDNAVKGLRDLYDDFKYGRVATETALRKSLWDITIQIKGLHFPAAAQKMYDALEEIRGFVATIHNALDLYKPEKNTAAHENLIDAAQQLEARRKDIEKNYPEAYAALVKHGPDYPALKKDMETKVQAAQKAIAAEKEAAKAAAQKKAEPTKTADTQGMIDQIYQEFTGKNGTLKTLIQLKIALRNTESLLSGTGSANNSMYKILNDASTFDTMAQSALDAYKKLDDKKQAENFLELTDTLLHFINIVMEVEYPTARAALKNTPEYKKLAPELKTKRAHAEKLLGIPQTPSEKPAAPKKETPAESAEKEKKEAPTKMEAPKTVADFEKLIAKFRQEFIDEKDGKAALANLSKNIQTISDLLLSSGITLTIGSKPSQELAMLYETNKIIPTMKALIAAPGAGNSLERALGFLIKLDEIEKSVKILQGLDKKIFDKFITLPEFKESSDILHRSMLLAKTIKARESATRTLRWSEADEIINDIYKKFIQSKATLSEIEEASKTENYLLSNEYLSDGARKNLNALRAVVNIIADTKVALSAYTMDNDDFQIKRFKKNVSDITDKLLDLNKEAHAALIAIPDYKKLRATLEERILVAGTAVPVSNLFDGINVKGIKKIINEVHNAYLAYGAKPSDKILERSFVDAFVKSNIANIASIQTDTKQSAKDALIGLDEEKKLQKILDAYNTINTKKPEDTGKKTPEPEKIQLKTSADENLALIQKLIQINNDISKLYNTYEPMSAEGLDEALVDISLAASSSLGSDWRKQLTTHDDAKLNELRIVYKEKLAEEAKKKTAKSEVLTDE
jgi:hypothetical protein